MCLCGKIAAILFASFKALLCDSHCGAKIIRAIYQSLVRNLSMLSNPYFPKPFHPLSNESSLLSSATINPLCLQAQL